MLVNMNKSIKLTASLLVAAILPSTAHAINVTTSTDANTLANNILGSGISISNVSLIGANTQQGTFTGGLADGIGIDAGIILTSGNANSADTGGAGNITDNTTSFTGTGSNTALTNLSGFSTNDQNVLKFDFTSNGGDVFFNYVFASEEYNEFVGSQFNDVFAFFLDGVNIALIPGTSTAVTINNVNNSSNSTFYNDNDPSNGIPTPYSIEYDGFTDVFTAQFLGLSAGTHTIELAIADAGDSSLDSAVFIQAGSFSDTKIPEPSSIALFGLGLLGLSFIRRRRI